MNLVIDRNIQIVKIKKEWLSAPNYRGLEDVKIEFQIRTILMHAWAEISHKFSYKKKDQIPTKDLERELFLISANFESSDKQLQVFKNKVEEYKDEVKLSLESLTSLRKKENYMINSQTFKGFDLNYDSLSALLDFYLSGYPRNQNSTMSSLERMRKRNFNIAQVEELLQGIQPYASEINKKVFPDRNLHLTQGTLLAYADDIFNSYLPDIIISDKRREIVEELKKKILADNKGKNG